MAEIVIKKFTDTLSTVPPNNKQEIINFPGKEPIANPQRIRLKSFLDDPVL